MLIAVRITAPSAQTAHWCS